MRAVFLVGCLLLAGCFQIGSTVDDVIEAISCEELAALYPSNNAQLHEELENDAKTLMTAIAAAFGEELESFRAGTPVSTGTTNEGSKLQHRTDNGQFESIKFRAARLAYNSEAEVLAQLEAVAQAIGITSREDFHSHAFDQDPHLGGSYIAGIAQYIHGVPVLHGHETILDDGKEAASLEQAYGRPNRVDEVNLYVGHYYQFKGEPMTLTEAEAYADAHVRCNLAAGQEYKIGTSFPSIRVYEGSAGYEVYGDWGANCDGELDNSARLWIDVVSGAVLHETVATDRC